MKTDAERGRYGRWLVAARKARGFDTADEAMAALKVAGIHIGSAYRQYESGSKIPSRTHLPLLEDYWGPITDPLEVPAQAHSKVTPDLIDEIEDRIRRAFREELRAALDELRASE